MDDFDDTPIVISKKMVLDPVQRKQYSSSLCRTCPHPAVQKKYGAGVQVSTYTCAKCKHKTYNALDFLECGYNGKVEYSDDDRQAMLNM